MLPHCVPTKRVYFNSFKTDMSVAGRFNLCFALQTLHCLSATFKIQNNTKIQKQWFRKLLSSPDKVFIKQTWKGMACNCSPIKKLTSTIEALISPASRTMYATPCCSFLMQSYINKQKINKFQAHSSQPSCSCTHRIIIHRSLLHLNT